MAAFTPRRVDRTEGSARSAAATNIRAAASHLATRNANEVLLCPSWPPSRTSGASPEHTARPPVPRVTVAGPVLPAGVDKDRSRPGCLLPTHVQRSPAAARVRTARTAGCVLRNNHGFTVPPLRAPAAGRGRREAMAPAQQRSLRPSPRPRARAAMARGRACLPALAPPAASRPVPSQYFCVCFVCVCFACVCGGGQQARQCC